jgi:hypothetical protein
MGKWGKKVAAALLDPSVQNGIAVLVARYSKEHIANSAGRGATGQEAALKPLKSIRGEYWTIKKPKDMTSVKQTRKKTVIELTKQGDTTVAKEVQVTEYLLESVSYREGGKPLLDTGQMLRDMGANSHTRGKDIQITIRGPLHAIFHESGFKTKGPNFIPLTRNAKRKHATGNNPAKEGLLQGKDYIMAWRGVTVPKRPFMVPTNNEWVEIGKSIRMGLARILKGRT